MRGLKHYTRVLDMFYPRSHPSRVRGLKPDNQKHDHYQACVAPFAGAWIETPLLALLRIAPEVAPFAGAWIETCIQRIAH